MTEEQSFDEGVERHGVKSSSRLVCNDCSESQLQQLHSSLSANTIDVSSDVVQHFYCGESGDQEGDAQNQDKKPPLRRTGSGDIIIGEVMLMEPRRRTQGASGEGLTFLSDLVQIELDAGTEPASSQGEPACTDDVTASWAERGKTAGKIVAALAMVAAWVCVVATTSTYYFLGARLGWTDNSDKSSNSTS
ncbi:uncharacterized protein LOC135394795 [Ornithodoros turicata]|uniref:uncharacterized protein LOC135394795 n=1 Tax=Ornithodoros turicata TaxID=34597 RepID=UPI0031399B88